MKKIAGSPKICYPSSFKTNVLAINKHTLTKVQDINHQHLESDYSHKSSIQFKALTGKPIL